MSDLKPLIEKLNPVCRRALEQAAARAHGQTQFTVEIEHLLLALLTAGDGDLARACAAYGVPADRLIAQLNQAIDGFKQGNGRTPALAPHLVDLLMAAWLVASLELGQGRIRSGAILKALLDRDELRAPCVEAVPLLALIPRLRLEADLPSLGRGGAEDGPTPMPTLGPSRADPAPSGSPGSALGTQALDAYTIDLTAEARAGRIDPIIGRDAEIRQLIDILMRRRQNNPILTGDAGVGKTAIVEGLAQRIVSGQVPPPLSTVALCSLDLGLLQAGAGLKGEFEQRLNQVIEEVAASPRPIVLFIDEAHSLIGAGGAAGQGDAANLLKPALARGSLRTIAATTWGEYKRYIEKDPALARRFQVVKVAEPDEATATEMLRGLAPKLEAHHNVRILDEAVAEAVRLSHRHISGRQLPDKAISVLDTACARVAVAQSDPPAALQDATRRATALASETARLETEARLGADCQARLSELADEAARLDEARMRLHQRWRQEQDTVRRIRAIEAALVTAARQAKPGEAATDLAALRLELETLQGETPLVPVAVDARVVAEVVAGWTGIPAGRMLTDTLDAARGLRQRMAARIIGQDAALDTICRRIQTFYAELGEPDKPTGVFLLAGPSGVGKTETAATLAELLFGGPSALITINMSEYQEAHSVSGLKGAPPGYVGYGKGGVLTEAVKRRPYCVLLLDEIEKAHGDVLELFYQVFDKGVLEDSDGQAVDFTNAVILLTSNAGSEILQRLGAGDPAALDAAIRPALLRHFPAAFLGRMVVVPYLPLDDAAIRAILRLKLARIQERFALIHRAELTYDEAVLDAIAERATETESGARNIDAILTQTLLPDLSAEILDRVASGAGIETVHVGIGAAGQLTYQVRG
jgi:type VI secretion system protein VasG